MSLEYIIHASLTQSNYIYKSSVSVPSCSSFLKEPTVSESESLTNSQTFEGVLKFGRLNVSTGGGALVKCKLGSESMGDHD